MNLLLLIVCILVFIAKNIPRFSQTAELMETKHPIMGKMRDVVHNMGIGMLFGYFIGQLI